MIHCIYKKGSIIEAVYHIQTQSFEDIIIFYIRQCHFNDEPKLLFISSGDNTYLSNGILFKRIGKRLQEGSIEEQGYQVYDCNNSLKIKQFKQFKKFEANKLNLKKLGLAENYFIDYDDDYLKKFNFIKLVLRDDDELSFERLVVVNGIYQFQIISKNKIQSFKIKEREIRDDKMLEIKEVHQYYLKEGEEALTCQSYLSGAIFGTRCGKLICIPNANKVRISFTIKVCHSSIRLISVKDRKMNRVLVVSGDDQIYMVNIDNLEVIKIDLMEEFEASINCISVDWKTMNIIICQKNGEVKEAKIVNSFDRLWILKSEVILRDENVQGIIFDEERQRIILRKNSLKDGGIVVMDKKQQVWTEVFRIDVKRATSIHLDGNRLTIVNDTKIQTLRVNNEGLFEELETIERGAGLIRTTKYEDKLVDVFCSTEGTMYLEIHK